MDGSVAATIQTQQQQSHTETLLAVARAVNSTLDFAELMRRVAREIGRVLGADMVGAYLADGDREVLRPVAGYHVPPELRERFLRFPISIRANSYIEEGWRSHQPAYASDALTDGRSDPALIAWAPLRSVIFFPLVVKDEPIGALFLIWWAPRPTPTPLELLLLEGIARQTALAIGNAQLFEETERLLAETQSQAAALREKNAELDTFVYTVSHDLKAPLVTIQGMSSLVLEDHAAALDEEGRHYLQRVVANTQQMERLILDLLALSRVGREARKAEVVHLAELVDDVLADLAEPLRARGIKVTVGDMQSVSAVRVQLEQVMRNLLTNAMTYMGDTPSPEIELGTIARRAEVEVWVRDTGIGIDPAYHEKVFEIFQRLKEIDADGSGVGLPIVKKIVRAAGGRIWVESARGQGSTFRFTWPVATGR